MQAGQVQGVRSATAVASSPHPGDWGRALACAISQLAKNCEIETADKNREQLLGRELKLVITPNDKGVQITVSRNPEQTA